MQCPISATVRAGLRARAKSADEVIGIAYEAIANWYNHCGRARVSAAPVVAGILKSVLNPGHPAPMLSLGTEANASGR